MYVLNISVIQWVQFKKQLNYYGSWWDRGRFTKELSFQHYLHYYSGTTSTSEIIVPVGSSENLLHQLLVKSYISRRSLYDQLATISFSHYPLGRRTPKRDQKRLKFWRYNFMMDSYTDIKQTCTLLELLNAPFLF